MSVNSYFICAEIFGKRTAEDPPYEILTYLFMASWLTLITWFFISVLVYYCKQSGVPYKSDEARANVKYISLLFILWSLAFVMKAILSYKGLKYAVDGDA
jgi:hypothetical protein